VPREIDSACWEAMKRFGLVRLVTLIPIGLYLAAICLPWAAMDLGFVPPCASCFVHQTNAKVNLVQLVGTMLLSPDGTPGACAISLCMALDLGTLQVIRGIEHVVSQRRSSFLVLASSLIVAVCLLRLRVCLQMPRLGWMLAFGGSLVLVGEGCLRYISLWRERAMFHRDRIGGNPQATVRWKVPLGSALICTLVECEGKLQMLRGSETYVRFSDEVKFEYGPLCWRPRQIVWSVVGQSLLGGSAVVLVVAIAMRDAGHRTASFSVSSGSLAFIGFALVVAITVTSALQFIEMKLALKRYWVTVTTSERQELGSFEIKRWQLEVLLDIAARARVRVEPRSLEVQACPVAASVDVSA